MKRTGPAAGAKPERDTPPEGLAAEVRCARVLQRTSAEYTDQHAAAGLDAALPEIECWENQFPSYEITIATPEFTSVCPRTGLPDHGTLTLTYTPRKLCLELKSLKMYLLAYRNLGIFQENIVNRYLRDVVAACDPASATVLGDFAARGGLTTKVTASYQRPEKGRRGRR